MADAEKQTKKGFYGVPPKPLIITVLALGLFIVVGYLVQVKYIQRYNEAADLASMVSTRELVLRAAKQTKTNAVVEPKTGDQYFPEAKLYLPNIPFIPDGLTYSIILGEKETELSISTQSVFYRTSSALYSARNSRELFDGLPKLQACQRGIMLAYKPLSAEEAVGSELKQTIRLNNGKDLYAYTERLCPELNNTVELLKNIRAY